VIAVAKWNTDRRRETLSQRFWRAAVSRRQPISPAVLSAAASAVGCRPETLARAIAMGVLRG